MKDILELEEDRMCRSRIRFSTANSLLEWIGCTWTDVLYSKQCCTYTCIVLFALTIILYVQLYFDYNHIVLTIVLYLNLYCTHNHTVLYLQSYRNYNHTLLTIILYLQLYCTYNHSLVLFLTILAYL